MRLPRLLPWGIGAGAMFALSMLGEHVVSHNIHHGKVFALVVFGTFFVTLFTGGAFATRATRRMTTGALTGLWTALIVSELWVLSLYWVYLSFVGTPLAGSHHRGAQVGDGQGSRPTTDRRGLWRLPPARAVKARHRHAMCTLRRLRPAPGQITISRTEGRLARVPPARGRIRRPAAPQS